MFDRGAFAVRSENHKLVVTGKDSAAALFNLAEDVGETKDLAEAERGKLEELERWRVAWNQQLIEPVFEGLIANPIKRTDEPAAD
jgi:hypothetical protein